MAGCSQKKVGDLAKQFRKFATKAGCEEVTAEDVVRWCADAGVLDVACSVAHIHHAFAEVVPESKCSIKINDMIPLIERISPYYAKDNEISEEDAVKAVRGLLGKVKGASLEKLGGIPDLEAQFRKFGMKAEGKEATLKDIVRWLTDAGVLKGNKKCSLNAVDIAFTATKAKGKMTITVDDMDKLVTRLSNEYSADHKMSKDMAMAKIYYMLANTEKHAHGATRQSITGGVDHLTDTTHYTGMHKERFDKEGRGKGIDGREDRTENTGYVANYKGAGTFDEKHPQEED